MFTLKNIFILLSSFVMLACSSTGRIEELIVNPDEVKISTQHNGSIRISVIGGDKLMVSSELFKTALAESLIKSKVFSSIKDSNTTEYKLFIAILRSESFKLGHGSLMTSQWILHKNDQEVMSETVTGNGSSNNFGGVARMRASAEGASKDTIRNGIEAISNLEL